MDVTYPLLSSGGSRGRDRKGGGGLEAPLFLDQTEARRAEKKLGDDRRHSPPPSLPLIFRSGSGTAEILFFLSARSENELQGC